MHCYRMLGSLQDAEDALQETLLAAWQGLDGFEGRASIRTWLYRIATNRCLNARRSASRRPAKEWDMPAVEPPEPTGFGEIPWLEPYPDSLLEGARCGPRGPLCADRSHLAGLRDRSSGPAASPARRARSCATSSDSTPARWPTCSTRPSNRSTAPSSGRAPACSAGDRRPKRHPPRTHPPSRRWWRSSSARTSPGTWTRLVALLTTDIFVSMPPIPLEYQGLDVVCPPVRRHLRLGQEG